MEREDKQKDEWAPTHLDGHGEVTKLKWAWKSEQNVYG